MTRRGRSASFGRALLTFGYTPFDWLRREKRMRDLEPSVPRTPAQAVLRIVSIFMALLGALALLGGVLVLATDGSVGIASGDLWAIATFGGIIVMSIGRAKENLPKIDALTFDDITKFYQANIQGKPYAIGIIGNPKMIDLDKLKKYGKVVKLNERKLFNTKDTLF